MKTRPSQLALPIGIVGIVLLLVVPLPAAVLDLLIAFNITAAVAILLVAVYVRRPLEFSSFPALILVMTLLRLGLNVSATRLVLRDGYEPGSALATELQEHVKQQTAPYKYPRIVDFAPELPKTPSGKIKRALLRAQPSGSREAR